MGDPGIVILKPEVFFATNRTGLPEGFIAWGMAIEKHQNDHRTGCSGPADHGIYRRASDHTRYE
jgi:hypothetical protein